MLFFPVEKIARLLPEIRTAVHREIYPIERFKFAEGTFEGAHCPEFDDEGWADFTVGDYWGGYDVEAWFRTSVEIPPHLRDKKLVLRFLVGPRGYTGGSTAETMLYVNGEPLQGIDVWHEEAWLPPELVEAGRIHVALHAWSGVLEVPDRRRFQVAELIWIDEAAERFYYLADALLRSIMVLDQNDLRRFHLLETLNQAFNRVDFTEQGSPPFYCSLAQAAQSLEAAVEALETREEAKPTVVGVGHAHIDMAWLWRLAHSRQKAARTFATALHLMRQYPEYRFVHSSPQLYKFLEQDYPKLFERVKARIRSGEWEITGGMWVEADTNLPSGESLVRQFLLGKRYIRETFGVESHVVWLPDVFGYSWALPQIVKKSGMKYFMTTKISWSQFNRFPYDTFLWRGIDGTELLTHFVTTPEPGSSFYTYNGQLSPSDVTGIWEQYRQKDVNDELLLLFGWGDGGGGPTREMLEFGRALKNLPGIPRVTTDKAEPYFERLEKRLAGRELSVWDDELYLEYHRGTYTSQAQIKRANRRAEVLYHDAEWLSALAELLTREARYPDERLRQGWELLLLNQFHDILPGSSIRQVYEDAERDYQVIHRLGTQAVEEAQGAVVRQIAVEEPSLAVFNSLAWRRDGLVALPWSPSLAGQTVLDGKGEPAPAQVVEEEGEKKLLVRVGDVPALGYRLYPLVPEPAPARAPALTVTLDHLENRYYRIELNPQGQITSLFDKLNRREVLAPNSRGNVLQAFEDKPLAFDAWDIDIYYREKMKEIDTLVEAEVEESGPIRGVLRLTWRFYNSTITQRLTIYDDSPRIDFRTEIDWNQDQVLLKVAFPIDVRATRATYEIQFGNIERPTHWNTSWDYARFETVGHRWVDLSEGNYGVALLNDSKYGHDVKDNVVRLTLLKSSIRPDPLADKGHHAFTYSLLPHAGSWRESRVVQEAYALNYPLLARVVPPQPGGALPHRYELATVESDHVLLETVKKAEDGEAWIVRLYEYKQYRDKQVTLRFARPIRRAVECNLIEEDEQPATYEGSTLTFPITPYEIKTFKVWF